MKFAIIDEFPNSKPKFQRLRISFKSGTTQHHVESKLFDMTKEHPMVVAEALREMANMIEKHQ